MVCFKCIPPPTRIKDICHPPTSLRFLNFCTHPVHSNPTFCFAKSLITSTTAGTSFILFRKGVVPSCRRSIAMSWAYCFYLLGFLYARAWRRVGGLKPPPTWQLSNFCFDSNLLRLIIHPCSKLGHLREELQTLTVLQTRQINR